MERFNEKLMILDEVSCHFLVHCPECNKQATVALSPTSDDVIRLTCSNCGHVKDWECTMPGARMWANDSELYTKGVVAIGDSIDWCFHLPLWLKASCCGHELWAYNFEHLEWLNSFIGAKLRERTKDEKTGWRNQSLASRLPAWMKSAKNRDRVLETIEVLKNKKA